MADITVPYQGLLSIPIKTYTTTYSSIQATWNFDFFNVTPMEFAAYGSGSAPQVTNGAKGVIFTRNFETPFSVGSITGSQNNVYAACAWFEDKIVVLATQNNGTNQAEPLGTAQALPLDGVGITVASPVWTLLEALPNLPNTVAPTPILGWGGVASMESPVATVGALYSWRIALVDLWGVWDGTINNQGTVDPGFNTTYSPHGIIPGSGTNNVYIDGTGTPDYQYELGGLLTGASFRPRSSKPQPAAHSMSMPICTRI